MSKPAAAVALLPPVVAKALLKFGDNLAVARMRRKESQRAWAKRLQVSVPTLIRMERGDPRVSFGVYATAVWLMGRLAALPEAIEPQTDLGALELDLRGITKRRAVRSALSIEKRLARAPKKP
jgi:transcriptional regulator with XRE-family HTH domain